MQKVLDERGTSFQRKSLSTGIIDEIKKGTRGVSFDDDRQEEITKLLAPQPRRNLINKAPLVILTRSFNRILHRATLEIQKNSCSAGQWRRLR